MSKLHVCVQHKLPALDIDVEVTAGDGRLAFFGPSGSGKTTILKAIAGTFRPRAVLVTLGERIIVDTEIRWPPPHERGIGVVFQDDRLFPHLSVEENIRYGAGRQSISDVCALAGVDHLLTRSVHTLSGGERRRVAIARALATNADLFLFDEPYNGLDRPTAEAMRAGLSQWLSAHTRAHVLVSHTLDDVLAHDGTIALMDNGKVIACGDAETVFNSTEGARLLGSGDAALQGGPVSVFKARTGETKDGLTSYKLNGATIRIPASDVALPGGYLKIRSADISLALHEPQGTSILNILRATVREISRADGFAMVELSVGKLVLKARITAYSAEELKLAPGLEVYAQIKSAALVR